MKKLNEIREVSFCQWQIFWKMGYSLSETSPRKSHSFVPSETHYPEVIRFQMWSSIYTCYRLKNQDLLGILTLNLKHCLLQTSVLEKLWTEGPSGPGLWSESKTKKVALAYLFLDYDILGASLMKEQDLCWLSCHRQLCQRNCAQTGISQGWLQIDYPWSYRPAAARAQPFWTQVDAMLCFI